VNALSQWFLGQGQYSHHGYQISHLAWTWNTWDCKNGPAVITNYDGTCTNNYGCTVKNLFENTPIVHSHSSKKQRDQDKARHLHNDTSSKNHT